MSGRKEEAAKGASTAALFLIIGAGLVWGREGFGVAMLACGAVMLAGAMKAWNE